MSGDYNYLQFIPLMSVWELGHRLAGIDPHDTNPNELPREVKDKIRELFDALYSVLNLYDIDGEPENGGYIPILGIELPNKAQKRVRQYFLKQEYPVDDLKSFFIERGEYKRYCEYYDKALPVFWFEDHETQKHEQWRQETYQSIVKPIQVDVPQEPRKLRPVQIDKLLCQDIAKRLWAESPLMRISEVMNHTDILIKGNGKLYEPSTRRKWVSEVAPQEVKNRRGRPKKNSD